MRHDCSGVHWCIAATVVLLYSSSAPLSRGGGGKAAEVARVLQPFCSHSAAMLDERLHGFCAGILAGAAGVLVGHPFDTLKVKMQVARQAPSAAPRAAFAAATPRSASVMALYRGIFPPLFSTGIVQSINFGIFENSRIWLQRHAAGAGEAEDAAPPLWSTSAAATLSGAATSPLTAIVTKVKVIQQARGTATLDVLRNLHNLRPFKHFPLHCTLESFGRGVYMTTYFGAKKLITTNGYDETELGWRVACGATSGIVAWTAIYPLDVLRSRLYSGSGAGGAGGGGGGMWSLLLSLHREGALFRGLGFTLVRAAPVAGVVLTMYDHVLDQIRAA